MILFFTIMGTILIYRDLNWLFSPEKKHYFTVLIMGVSYTLFSEYRNVFIEKNWSYSELMPEIGGIGLIPILQWVLLPALILYIIGRFLSTDKE